MKKKLIEKLTARFPYRDTVDILAGIAVLVDQAYDEGIHGHADKNVAVATLNDIRDLLVTEKVL